MAININVPGGGTDTSDATASSADILDGKTAYVNDEKVVGSIPIKTSQTYIPSTSNVTIPGGNYLSGDQVIQGDQNLIAENIKKGKSIFGVNGTCTPLEISNSRTIKVIADSDISSGNFVEFTGKSYKEKTRGESSDNWGLDTFSHNSEIDLYSGITTDLNTSSDFTDTNFGYIIGLSNTTISIYNYKNNTSCSLVIGDSDTYTTHTLCSIDQDKIISMYYYPMGSRNIITLLKYNQDKNTITRVTSVSISTSEIYSKGISYMKYISHKNNIYMRFMVVIE